MSSKLERRDGPRSAIAPIYKAQASPPEYPLDQPSCLVTGSNVGTGFEASRQLLHLQLSHLIMGVRYQSKGDAAADALRREFPGSNISVWHPDHDQIWLHDRIRYGHETMTQVNYLSNVLLTILLLPVLKAKTNATNKPPIDNPEGFMQMAWYGKSKLLLTLFIITLVNHVDPNNVLVNMVNPDMTRGTNIKRELPSLYGAIMAMLYLVVGRSVVVAATTYADAVVAHGPETHGCFIGDWVIKP
ncbi:hypothetical protein TruAng_005169 [Truncatella angustata]|nr:hypothetical protein TruAng_005169 [Truncatella angustata]